MVNAACSVRLPDVKEPSIPARPTMVPIPSKNPRRPRPLRENFIWVKQNARPIPPWPVVLQDGEVLRGTIEWYDHDCIKLTRRGSPNLLIFKRVIKYLYKMVRILSGWRRVSSLLVNRMSGRLLQT